MAPYITTFSQWGPCHKGLTGNPIHSQLHFSLLFFIMAAWTATFCSHYFYTSLLISITPINNNKIQIEPLQYLSLINIVFWLLFNIWVLYNANVRNSVVKMPNIMYCYISSKKYSPVIGHFPFCNFNTRPLETRPNTARNIFCYYSIPPCVLSFWR